MATRCSSGPGAGWPPARRAPMTASGPRPPTRSVTTVLASSSRSPATRSSAHSCSGHSTITRNNPGSPAQSVLPKYTSRPMRCESHVFQHVPEERALAQLGQQAAWLPSRAVVPGESRQGLEQPLGEAGELVGLAAGEFTEVDKRHGYRLRAVDVRAAQSSQCYDTHG